MHQKIVFRGKTIQVQLKYSRCKTRWHSIGSFFWYIAPYSTHNFCFKKENACAKYTQSILTPIYVHLWYLQRQSSSSNCVSSHLSKHN